MVKCKVANLVKSYPYSINIYVNVNDEVNVIIRSNVMPCSGIDIITACLRSRSNGRIIYHLVMNVSELLCIWGSDDISLSVS